MRLPVKEMARIVDAGAVRPGGRTARIFEQAEIPFNRIATLGALDQVTEGIVVIGEGIDLTKVNGLGESMLLAAGRDVSVLCPATEKGDLPYPDEGRRTRRTPLRWGPNCDRDR